MKPKYCAYAAVVAVSIMLIFAGMYINQGSASYTAASKSQSQNFTANGTFIVPAGVSLVYVTAWAGGGGGGRTNDATSDSGSGGGGGGEYVVMYPISIASGTSVLVTVGHGGNGSVSNGQTFGYNGGNTSFGTLLTVEGGKGSPAGVSGVVSNNGGYGGGVLGGNETYGNFSLVRSGGSGGGRGTKDGGSNLNGYLGGNSGAARGGGGGAGYNGKGADAPTGAGTNGTDPGANSGAGGSGAYVTNPNPNKYGGNGSAGGLIVFWVG